MIVPTDPLRERSQDKFLTHGILKDFGIVGPGALYPVVGVLKHKPKTVEEMMISSGAATSLLPHMAIAAGCGQALQKEWPNYAVTSLSMKPTMVSSSHLGWVPKGI